MTETKSPEAMEQRSEEWYRARLGKVTASRVYDIIKTIKSGAPAASRRNYCAELVTERLSGRSNPRWYTNEYMEWGKEQEPFAREAYTQRTLNEIVEVGIVDHPTLPFSAASPDGLIGDDGLIEIKCFIPSNHLELLLTEEIKESYKLQMLWQMACTGRQWCDFVSYDPSQREDMQLFIQRVERNETDIKNLENDVEAFLKEVEEMTNALKEKF